MSHISRTDWGVHHMDGFLTGDSINRMRFMGVNRTVRFESCRKRTPFIPGVTKPMYTPNATTERATQHAIARIATIIFFYCFD